MRLLDERRRGLRPGHRRRPGGAAAGGDRPGAVRRGWSRSPRSASPCWTPDLRYRPGQPGAGADQRHPGRGPHRPHGAGGPAAPRHRHDRAAHAARSSTTGTPLLDQYHVGRTAADPDNEHAWSVSFYRLEDPGGRVLGVADLSVVDVTERHRAATEAARARQRLALIADASARVGTTLEVERTARELADVAVPELADVAAVDVLDSVAGRPAHAPPDHGPAALLPGPRRQGGLPHRGVRAADPPGELAAYDADRLVTRCVHTARPVLVPHVGDRDLPRIARDDEAAALLAARGGPLLPRRAADRPRRGARRPRPQAGPQPACRSTRTTSSWPASWPPAPRCASTTPAGSRASATPPSPSSAACCPDHPPHHTGPGDRLPLPARPGTPARSAATGSTSSRWAATRPRWSSATSWATASTPPPPWAGCAPPPAPSPTSTSTPAAVLRHLDKITCGLEHYIATCAVRRLRPAPSGASIANAGHLPPVLTRPGRRPELLDLPTGAPLGVGGVPFEPPPSTCDPGDRLVLYTDGLVETRAPRHRRPPGLLLDLLAEPEEPLEEPATGSCTPCATRTTTTTSPCSSPARTLTTCDRPTADRPPNLADL